jgi:hypothetical protein
MQRHKKIRILVDNVVDISTKGRMAKLVDAGDLKSSEGQPSSGFKSRSGHQSTIISLDDYRWAKALHRALKAEGASFEDVLAEVRGSGIPYPTD